MFRKVLVIGMMMIISASSVGCAVIESNIISLFLFFTIFLGVVVNGMVSSYFVDLFPTSYRYVIKLFFLVKGPNKPDMNL